MVTMSTTDPRPGPGPHGAAAHPATGPRQPGTLPHRQSPGRPAGAKRHGTGRRVLGLVAAAALLGAAIVLALAVGARHLPVPEIWAALRGRPVAQEVRVVMDLRLARTAVGLVAGMGLATSGALVQAVTRNPLADPGILGTTAGAAFAVAMVAGLSGLDSQLGLLLAAFLGAAAATVGVHAIGSLGPNGGNPVQLVLAGTALGAVLNGITSGLVLSDPQRFTVMQAWRAGSLADRGWAGLPPALPFLLLGLLLALAIAGSLNAIALGDDLATALGANVALVRTLTLVAVTLLAGTATALAGPIAFVGLMVPHAARRICGPDQRWILAFSLVLGPALLLLADVLGRVVMPPGELAAGIVTAFLGAPVLIWLARGRLVEL